MFFILLRTTYFRYLLDKYDYNTSISHLTYITTAELSKSLEKEEFDLWRGKAIVLLLKLAAF